MVEISPLEAFQHFLKGGNVEYFAQELWWELDEHSPVILFIKYERWRIKD